MKSYANNYELSLRRAGEVAGGGANGGVDIRQGGLLIGLGQIKNFLIGRHF